MHDNAKLLPRRQAKQHTGQGKFERQSCPLSHHRNTGVLGMHKTCTQHSYNPDSPGQNVHTCNQTPVINSITRPWSSLNFRRYRSPRSKSRSTAFPSSADSRFPEACRHPQPSPVSHQTAIKQAYIRVSISVCDITHGPGEVSGYPLSALRQACQVVLLTTRPPHY